MEAHGGYAFCGLAALTMLRKAHLCDLKALLVSICIFQITVIYSIAFDIF